MLTDAVKRRVPPKPMAPRDSSNYPLIEPERLHATRLRPTLVDDDLPSHAQAIAWARHDCFDTAIVSWNS
jgi:hypothetical protein